MMDSVDQNVFCELTKTSTFIWYNTRKNINFFVQDNLKRNIDPLDQMRLKLMFDFLK